MDEPEVDDCLNLPEGDQLEEHMEENVAGFDTQYEESSEDEIRKCSPLRGAHLQIFRTSDRKTKTKGIKPLRYREM